MFSKNRVKRRRSLALRLTLGYAGIFTVSAGVAFLLFYLLITSVFRNYTDQELSNQNRSFAKLLAARGIEVVKRGIVRRAKLYYLRERKGKAARIKERR